MKLMAVGGRKVSREDVTEQVDRLVSSAILSHSESLCRLLRFLADHASDYPKTQVKEYQIATEVFGRPADFDPRLDSTVRVQTGRLRSKLAEYYAGPGKDDLLVVEMPKGAYALTVHERLIPEVPPAVVPAPPAAVVPPPQPSRNLPRLIWALALAVIVLSGSLIYVLREQSKPNEQVKSNAVTVPPILKRFWSRFIDNEDPAVVVFSNAEFVGRPETGMKYFDPSRDRRDHILDHYTGTGEVAAVHELDMVFFQLGHRLRVKRGRLLSFDDAKQNDLIFVGSPSENLTLRELPNLQEFVFRRVSEGTRRNDLSIVNLRPDAGEETQFLASPETPLVEDYAVVGFVPGVGVNHWAMVLAGITTIGTQAAVEFVCRPAQLEALLARLGVNGEATPVPPFEAVLRVKVSAGVPVETRLVAIHKHAN
jgi:hypothetical protein